jgi:hypothetical protein
LAANAGARAIAAADDVAAAAAGRAVQLRGHRQQAASKDQAFHCARGALGDQTDPLEPAGRRFGNFV